MNPTLHNHVEARIRAELDHIAAFRQVLGTGPVLPAPGATRDAVKDKIFAIFMSKRFRRQLPPDPEPFRAAISHAVDWGIPVACVLGHGPLKNRRNSVLPYADWAEFFSLMQLVRLAEAVRTVYAPGIQVALYLDDSRAESANAVPAHLTALYRESLQTLIAALGLECLIPEVVSVKAVCPSDVYAVCLVDAEAYITGWEADPENTAMLSRFRDQAGRNLPAGLSDDVREDAIHTATHDYLVRYEAEKRCGIWSQPKVIHLWYSDRADLYQIFSLRKGSVVQPWQGQGVLVAQSAEGEGLQPDVMTLSRRLLLKPLATLPLPFGLPYLETISIMQPQLVSPYPMTVAMTNTMPTGRILAAVPE